jgi:hypothetical protein
MQYYEAMAEAVRIANQVLAGELDPNHGCSMIAGIGEDLDYPEALSAFFLLSHEQYDHEHLGITAESCIPDLLDACRELVITRI